MTTKYCPKCDNHKPLTGFHKNKSRGDGHAAYCKPCTQSYQSDWFQSDGATRYRKLSRARQRRGTTDEQVREIFKAQGSVCAICESPEPKGKGWHLDHCHETGKNRGVLCHNCNRGLGYMKDSVEILQTAVSYLKTHSTA